VLAWAALRAVHPDAAKTAAAPSHSATALGPAPVTTTTATPPPPTVAPADLTELLPTLGDVKNLVGDDN
jgi:eukaryotic-like serine/threonine-protein kinase